MSVETVIGAVVAAAIAWWLWRRLRSPERMAAKRRYDLGYRVGDGEESEPAPDRDTASEWRALLDRPDVVIVDTETTGLGDRAEVIEVAVLDTTGAVRFEALSLPQGRIPRDASDIHGLTRAILKAEGARPWPDVHSKLAAVLDGAAVVLAWNAEFDARLLVQTASRHGLTFPKVQIRDALTDYREIRREAPARGRHKLTAVMRREGAKVDGPAHRATADCRAVLAVVRAVVESRGEHRPRQRSRQRARAGAREAPMRDAVVPLDDPAPSIVFEGRRFVFTGDFAFGDRAACEQAVIERGGEIAKNLSKRVAYVVIGEHGSDDWKHGNFGTKVAKAMQLRDDGAAVAIVTERHWREQGGIVLPGEDDAERGAGRMNDAALAAVDALTRLMNDAPVLTARERERLRDAFYADVERRYVDGDVPVREALETPAIYNQDHASFRATLRETDNDLGWQCQFVTESFARFQRMAEVPAPHFPMRIAIILRKAREPERERAFLAAWCRHFGRENNGVTYIALARRAKKLGAKP